MTFWTTIKRVARYGLIGFVRNGFVSLAAVMIMTITLFVVGMLLVGGAALDSTLKQLTDKVDVTVYFDPSASTDQIMQVANSLKALPEVASVDYVSPDQALATFRDRHQNDQLTLQALDELGSNPLGASLEVKAKETSQYEAIAQFLSTQQKSDSTGSIIDKVNFFQNKTAIDRLTNIIEASRRIAIVTAVILALSTILIAFNTIRLAIYSSRDEINVMTLVGAGRWYVRGPFMISGILYGIVSAMIVLLIMYPLMAWMGPGSQKFFGTFNVFDYFLSSFPYIFVVIMGSGIALGALSSYLAVRRYLNS